MSLVHIHSRFVRLEFRRGLQLTTYGAKRYLQIHPQTINIPQFDPSAIVKDVKQKNNSKGSAGNLKGQSSSSSGRNGNGLLWQAHGLNNAAAATESAKSEADILSSIFESEEPPSKEELEKLLSDAKKKLNAVSLETNKAEKKLASAATDPKTERYVEQKPAEKKYRKFTPRKAALTLTPNAVSHVKDLMDLPEPKLLRIGVRNRGCSGLQYHLEYVDVPGKFDEEVVQDGVKVLIDSKALFSIIGSEMDWVDDKLSNRFVFHNPNIKGECGCGESFMV
ncbi:hypothetical protein V1511DRAFT_501307 [Dipodascopsis uninucleata]